MRLIDALTQGTPAYRQHKDGTIVVAWSLDWARIYQPDRKGRSADAHDILIYATGFGDWTLDPPQLGIDRSKRLTEANLRRMGGCRHGFAAFQLLDNVEDPEHPDHAYRVGAIWHLKTEAAHGWTLKPCEDA